MHCSGLSEREDSPDVEHFGVIDVGGKGHGVIFSKRG